jgi:hypothetical protein
MQLDKLELDLRPRPNAQALDLGFTLLRAHAGPVYKAWLALWLPLVTLCCIIALFDPAHEWVWLLAGWWLRPMLERAPLYMLSRAVFGEEVTWRQALRAWPKQLGGGWFRLLTWWRPFAAGRGLYQPIWVLEGARGAVAAERRKVLGGSGTARSAYWFGIVCVHLEAVLQFGVVAFVGVFLSDEHIVNPLAFLFHSGPGSQQLSTIAWFAGYALADGIIGPIYTACCFTLYLNRRSNLEAWDIEITLRQMKPPQKAARFGTSLAQWALPLIIAVSLWHPLSAQAQTEKAEKCTRPDWAVQQLTPHASHHDAEQAKLRGEVATLFQSEDLRNYVCEENWARKKTPKKDDQPFDPKMPDLSLIAAIVKAVLIGAAIFLVVWLLYRYRDYLVPKLRRTRAETATEIAGLDIRPESLPDDVAAAVRELWTKGERRAALALLYRATLSKLASEDGLMLNKGATENDCLRSADRAWREQRLSRGRLDVVTDATALWLNAAYGNRWPDAAAVEAACVAWQTQFAQPHAPRPRAA